MRKLLSPKQQKLMMVIGLVALMSVFAFAPKSGTVHLAVAAGTPDAYENQILYVEVYQWNNVSSYWELQGNVTQAAYTAGVDVDVDPGRNIRFFVKGGINTKFAGSEAEAVLNVRSYITIAGELSRTLMTDDNCTGTVTAGAEELYAVWSHYYWTVSGGKPLAGNTYTVSLEFQCYYDPDDYA